jgi:hypothetical protein
MNAPQQDNEAERKRRLRTRNLALFAALLAFVVIVYMVSIVRMGGE